MKEVNIYLGPSGYDLGDDFLKDLNYKIHPPVKKYDIDNLVASSTQPGIIVLVDGVFFPYPAVGHVEIREAIAKGWELWGLSSMGAIRAYEMRNDGMKGFGYVYSCFFEQEDFKDDEMALLYNPEKPYHPITEPLINIRYFLSHLVSANLITTGICDEILNVFSQLWFGERTLDLLETLLLKHDCDPDVFKELDDFKKYRIKTIDVVNFFNTRPCLMQE